MNREKDYVKKLTFSRIDSLVLNKDTQPIAWSVACSEGPRRAVPSLRPGGTGTRSAAGQDRRV